MNNSIRLGKIAGIEVGIHWSWIFIFFVVTWSFAEGVLDRFYPDWTDGQRWIAGALVSAVFFLSVLAHELSHAVVSNRLGLPVRSISLFIFGGVANLSKEPDTAGDEFKIAIVGPLTSLAAGAFFAIVWAILMPFNEGIAGVSANMAIINVVLAIFNMLPGFPLDGGRVFRSIVWSRNNDRLRATRLASRVGEWVAYGVMALGALQILVTGSLSGFWLIFIGFFLRNAATESYEQLVIETTLSGIRVRDVMRTEYETIPPDTTVEDLVHDGILRSNARCFAVIAGGDFAGLVTLTDVRRLPRDEWPSTSVFRAMTPATRLHSVRASDSLASVLQLMAEHDVNQLPVLEGRALIGMLDRGDVMRFIQVRRDLREMAGELAAPSAGEPAGRA